MSHHVQGQSRTQTTLLPEVLDDFATEENPIRVIDVFVNEINLESLGFNRGQAKKRGVLVITPQHCSSYIFTVI